MVNPLIGMPQGAEWLVILVIVVLVFGAAKLPELARGTGQALRIFKSETKGLRDDETPVPPAPTELKSSELPPVTQAPPVTPVTPTTQSDTQPQIRPDNHTG